MKSEHSLSVTKGILINKQLIYAKLVVKGNILNPRRDLKHFNFKVLFDFSEKIVGVALLIFCIRNNIRNNKIIYSSAAEIINQLLASAMTSTGIETAAQGNIRFRFLRLSTIKKCPHMLKSDHRELRNS